MSKPDQPKYSLGEQGEFIIEGYDRAKPFASFFPGIAGPDGIPMWLFYVNRGQCVCSMGIEDKENPIMEFLSANRAYQLAGNQGFRTFLKIAASRGQDYYEPFQSQREFLKHKRTRRMIIKPASLTLEEENRTLGLLFRVNYFNVPGDEYAGLVRVLEIENIGKKTFKLEGMDGLPLIIPFGVDNYNLKNMRRLVESFVEVTNVQKQAPFFKGKVKQEDRPEVLPIREGNFYVGFEAGKNGTKRLPVLVDPVCVFGDLTDYSHPERFLESTPFKLTQKQILENRLPCALGLFQTTLPAGKTYTLYSIIGHADSEAALNRLVPKITKPAYIAKKRQENEDLVDQITQNNFVNTSSKEFDLYSRQNFLDNVMRGGLPITLEGAGKKTTLHLYSRKHGDLERDYNDYRLSATNYSQGNGNFRDVNQNRRSDLYFNPDIQEGNLEHFFNLIQLDGFNPLVVKSTSFTVANQDAVDALLRKNFPETAVADIKKFLAKRFAPGQFMSFLSQKQLALKGSPDAFMGELLAACDKHQETDAGHGYWSDHWEYNLDLIENFLALYPEKLRSVLCEKKTFTFYDNPHVVQRRADKYVLWEGRAMQLGAVVRDPEKEKLLRQRGEDADMARTQYGRGEIYRTTLAAKILSLIANKIASLDPEGVGVEMESDKPNWYDALNGLPGQLGSSLNETIEVKRLANFLLASIAQLGLDASSSWKIHQELYDYIGKLSGLLKQNIASSAPNRAFEYWDQSALAKEEFRDQIRLGVSGQEAAIGIGQVKEFLTAVVRKLDEGIRKSWNPKANVPSTYFINQVADYEPLYITVDGKQEPKRNAKGQACFRAKRFKQIPLPLFLEGPVHYLRDIRDTEKARELYQNIRRSGLYDKKLKMYKVNETLEDQPMEIGRTKIFSRGWLENESIWMHMEYKYFLELLRCGLHQEYYEDIQHALVPFMDAAVYGRSILENSSFIASSANPDPTFHGTGFVARLSGSTAEFIHILLLMTAGEKPFTCDAKGELAFRLQPALPGWLFTTQASKARLYLDNQWKAESMPAGSLSFLFLGKTVVTYLNPKRQDTFGKKAVKVLSYRLLDSKGKAQVVEGDTIRGDWAQKIRRREVAKIEVQLG